jgi:mannose-1-phosphate guanylyltransferase
MCGGIGSRFWPVSRNNMPKQFLDFFGTGRTLLQATLDRVKHLVDNDHIYVVTNAAYIDELRRQLPEIPEQNIMAEPARRNTAPCICWSAYHLRAIDPQATIITLPSDHLILKEIAFVEAMKEGVEFVRHTNSLLTLGIKPTTPHTGYGYIQKGKELHDFQGFMKVKSFTEKPNLELAQFFLKSGEFFWNSGIFIWNANDIISAFDEYDPETAIVFRAGKEIYGTAKEMPFINEIFSSAPSNSVDYAIMEKADNVYVKTVDLGWSDLGSWKALRDMSPRTKEGNVTQNCKVMATDCHNSVFSVKGDKIIVAKGLDDYVVAENDDAILIYPIADEQKLRQVVNEVELRFGKKYI